MDDPSAIPLEQLLKKFRTDAEHGLASQVIDARRQKWGLNQLQKEREKTVIEKALTQFKSPLVFILLIAGLGTLFLEEFIDAIVIFMALSVNVVIGTFQEERASQAFEKLDASQEKYATVIRDGERHIIPAEELVPGDVVFIESGAAIPADIRIISANNLSVNEAALTGEWIDVNKQTEESDANAPITDQKNMGWMGTLVTDGFGTGVVVATGVHTQVGEIAASLGSVEEHETPLQASIGRTARFLVYFIGIAIVGIFVVGVLQGSGIGEMLLISIAVAVAAIPAGLPAAVTVVLALGMESILKRGGLVRNLLAAETLGATTTILTDKTGTLTQASMALKHVITYAAITDNGTAVAEIDIDVALTAAIAASDAFIERTENGDEVRGKPLDRAILQEGLQRGITPTDIYDKEPQLEYIPFSSDRRFAASLHRRPGKRNRLYVSGVPEEMIALADAYVFDGVVHEMTETVRESFLRAQNTAASEGLRLIGTGYADVSVSRIDGDGVGERIREQQIVLVGLLAFHDPVRTDVSDAIKTVQGAGARVIMLTGDNVETARTVATMVGIAGEGAMALTGTDIDDLDDTELYARLMDTNVFARVLPAQKLRMARILKNRGEVVAMTGDGVNDAPALRSANIGVAVGSGTAVAQEASDIVLLDDSFSIIVGAIEEGRKIIDNLKKIVAYLLSTSFSEIILIGGALIVGAPLPILPTQILWANIVEEGLMSFAFAFEKAEPDIMKRDPRSAKARNVLTPDLKKMIYILTAVTGTLLLVLFAVLSYMELPIDEIRTFMFVALSLDSILFGFALKSFRKPFWHIKMFSNRYLIAALFASIALLFAAVTFPPLQTLLSTVSLNWIEWLALGGVALFNLALIEITKYILFRRVRTESAA